MCFQFSWVALVGVLTKFRYFDVLVICLVALRSFHLPFSTLHHVSQAPLASASVELAYWEVLVEDWRVGGGRSPGLLPCSLADSSVKWRRLCLLQQVCLVVPVAFLSVSLAPAGRFPLLPASARWPWLRGSSNSASPLEVVPDFYYCESLGYLIVLWLNSQFSYYLCNQWLVSSPSICSR